MNKIHETAIIYEGVQIGDNVEIGPYCIIGAPAEIKTQWRQRITGKVRIEDGVVITGQTTIDSGSKGYTVIGKDCFIMKQVHIGHDAQIGKRVVISPGARIGGGVIIEEDCNVGMNATIHQQVRVPKRCMIGMGSAVVKKRALAMKPMETWAGCPAQLKGPNKKWFQA